MIDFRVTVRQGTKAANAFLNKSIKRIRPQRSVTIVTDKATKHGRVICDINCGYDPHFDSIRHIDTKWRKNLFESDQAAFK